MNVPVGFPPIPLPPGMAAPQQPRAQLPGGFPVDTAHNTIFMLAQFYGTLLTEQAKRIDILASQLGNEQRERLKLSQENTQLRQKLVDALTASVELTHDRQDEEGASSAVGEGKATVG